jgi:serine/threonine-protein kinase
MVTGRVPFEGKNPSAVMHKHLKSELVPPDHINPKLSAGCAQVIEMMMAKDPADRYQNATDLLEDLELIAKGEPPHFARRTLDHTQFTAAMTDEVKAPLVLKAPEAQHAPRLLDSTAFTVVLIILAFSVLANIILLALTLSGS